MSELEKIKIKRLTRNFIVNLNDFEQKLVFELEEKGFRRPDIFRLGVRMLHKKEFPLYVHRIGNKSVENFRIKTDKDCLREAGEIVEEEGIKKCKLKRGKLTYYILLENVKEIPEHSLNFNNSIKENG